MISKQPLSILLFIVLFFVFISSCKKEGFNTNSNVSLSLPDSIKFDTVFTSIGNITQEFGIENTYDQKILLNKIQLAGGSNSPFKININGIPGPEADNITIDANDSIDVFVTININPNAANLPFVINDSILISYNGNNSFIHLQAYGQNAHFLKGKIIKSDTTWTNDLPYVILDSLQIATGATLTINKGCRIYSHANAPFLVDGTLIANGTKQDSIIFTGDRLDADYAVLPASWPGIYFRNNSINNVLTQTIIKNADKALLAYNLPTNANPKVTLHQCIIDNAYTSGIFCYNSSMDVDNSLISNCGSNVILNYGGTYNFTYCTVASYSNNYILHKSPVLQISNIDSTGTLNTNINASFRNCIFWGGNSSNIADEVQVNIQGTSQPIVFDHVLYEVSNDPTNSTLTSIINNQDPNFKTINTDKGIYDFHLSTGSPAIDSGTSTFPLFMYDLDDSARVVGIPDLGCYEKQ